jgi:hypothetical protein
MTTADAFCRISICVGTYIDRGTPEGKQAALGST